MKNCFLKGFANHFGIFAYSSQNHSNISSVFWRNICIQFRRPKDSRCYSSWGHKSFIDLVGNELTRFCWFFDIINEYGSIGMILIEISQLLSTASFYWISRCSKTASLKPIQHGNGPELLDNIAFFAGEEAFNYL